MIMNVCYFGIYKSSYTRNAVNIKGLRQNGVTVFECNTREVGNKKYWQLIKKYWQIRKEFQVIFVGFPGHTIMPLAWLLAKIGRQKIVFDAFVSLYDSMVLDRQKHRRISFGALKYWLIDWLSCKLADVILLDTNEHIKYFVRTFKVPKKKFKRIFVGIDDEIVRPIKQAKNTNNFLVHFHGTYIPAQGIPYIVGAAEILKNEAVEFNIIGRLNDYYLEIEKSRQLDLKVNFIDFLPYNQLIEKISEADVCLGMFGATDKTLRTGAFKVVEAMAMAKPVITGDTPAMRELFISGENCLFCQIADANGLAMKILELKNNRQLREKVARNGYELYLKRLTPKKIGLSLIEIIDN